MRRNRWVALLVVLLLVTPFTWSYASYLVAPGSASVAERSVEWVRDHGGSPVVDGVEQWWYTRHGPGTAPPPVGVLPHVPAPVPARGATVAGAAASRAPANLAPLTANPMPGEGLWAPGMQSVDGAPVMRTTFLRPDAAHGGVVAGVAWFDQGLVRTVAVPGKHEPGGGGWAWDARIPIDQRQTLLAAFNSGFRFHDNPGGYVTEGRTAVPVVDGNASLVIDRSGTVDVVKWGRDATDAASLATVRQNLHLIVDGGRPVPGLDRNGQGLWGSANSQLQYTWRSGIGVTADGNLVLAAGPKMHLVALAEALSRAGAVRAMELDIHSGQVTANLYAPQAGSATDLRGVKLMPTMPKSTDRYLTTDQRDFFAVFVR